MDFKLVNEVLSIGDSTVLHLSHFRENGKKLGWSSSIVNDGNLFFATQHCLLLHTKLVRHFTSAMNLKQFFLKDFASWLK